MNDRASVMEYPSPRIKVANGKIDLTDAYQKQIGAYDIMMVRYAYTVFPTGKEKAGLDGVIADMRKQGLIFTPSTDPRWNRYDDGSDPAEYLRQTIAQRKVLLANYGPAVLKTASRTAICAASGSGWSTCIIAGPSTRESVTSEACIRTSPSKASRFLPLKLFQQRSSARF